MITCTTCHAPAHVVSYERDGYTIAIRVQCRTCGIEATKIGGRPGLRVGRPT